MPGLPPITPTVQYGQGLVLGEGELGGGGWFEGVQGVGGEGDGGGPVVKDADGSVSDLAGVFGGVL